MLYIFPFLIIFLYFILIATYSYGWLKLKPYEQGLTEPCFLFVSVVVAARNEEKNITHLLDCLLNRNYPKQMFEIIIVDDHSTDFTQKIITETKNKNHQIKYIKLSENFSGKKTAINQGIREAKGLLILTTDADCRMSENWISTIASYYDKYKPKMILSPVIFTYNNVFSQLQSLEFLSLMVSTGGSAAIKRPILCNAANMAFERDVYLGMNDAMNAKYTSGDDIFFMLNVKKLHKDGIHFLKSQRARVFTKSCDTLKEFVNQRKRWVSKSSGYRDTDIIFSSLVVFFTSLVCVCAFSLSFISFDFSYFIILLSIKSLIDFIALVLITRFFRKTRLLKWFAPLEFFYPFYVVVIVFLSSFQIRNWK